MWVALITSLRGSKSGKRSFSCLRTASKIGRVDRHQIARDENGLVDALAARLDSSTGPSLLPGFYVRGRSACAFCPDSATGLSGVMLTVAPPDLNLGSPACPTMPVPGKRQPGPRTAREISLQACHSFCWINIGVARSCCGDFTTGPTGPRRLRGCLPTEWRPRAGGRPRGLVRR